MNDPFDPLRRQRATIVNAKGLHARAAAKLAKLAAGFAAEMTVGRNDTRVSARSIMGMMMLAAARGAEIEITARGPDADAALAAAVALVRSGFGETD